MMQMLKSMRWFVVSLSWLVVACGAPASKPAENTAPAAAAAPGVSEVSGTVPKGAVVSLQPASGAAPLPPGPAVMDQYSKRFEPDVLYARVGQPVEFKNSEDMSHNVTVVRRGPGTTIFNVGTEPQQKYVHTFDRPGQYDVLCDIHPGMQAVVIAADSATATVADDSGRFSFAAVPVGTYTMRVTFEGRTVEQEVSVAGVRTEVRFKGTSD